MTQMQWEPVHNFLQLQDRINRVFSETYGRGGEEGLMTSGTWIPPVDIFQNGDHELVLKAELPGMTREDIEITIDNNTLTIKGEKKLTDEVKDDQFHRVERRHGVFSRSFSLPPTVDPTKVSAEYKNGVLTLKLPLREEAKPHQIHVDVAAYPGPARRTRWLLGPRLEPIRRFRPTCWPSSGGSRGSWRMRSA